MEATSKAERVAANGRPLGRAGDLAVNGVRFAEHPSGLFADGPRMLSTAFGGGWQTRHQVTFPESLAAQWPILAGFLRRRGRIDELRSFSRPSFPITSSGCDGVFSRLKNAPLAVRA